MADADYTQRDLAQAWNINDAVVSRFISTGKPDLTPERQMILAQMLGLTNDQLLNRLYGGLHFASSPMRLVSPPSNQNNGGIEQAHAEIRRAMRGR